MKIGCSRPFDSGLVFQRPEKTWVAGTTTIRIPRPKTTFTEPFRDIPSDNMSPPCRVSTLQLATRDTQAKVLHRGWVREFAKSVEPTGRFWKEYGQAAYTYDKSVCGLLDAYTLAASPDALPALRLATEAVLPYLPDKAETKQEYEERRRREKIETGSYDEAYTLPENQFLAWRATGDLRYRKLATRFVYDQYFDPLSQDHNVLAGKHAYSHVNALSSAVQAYLVLGSPKYLAAARNGFRMVQEQSFATGGWGPNEFFLDPNRPSVGPRPNDNALFGQSDLYGDVGESLIRTHHSFETPCGAYGHFKIARYLLRITRDSSYGDSMERVLYNTVLGAKPIQSDGRSFYYSDYNNERADKVFYPSAWPCCSGTLPQISADYRISAYFHSPKGIYVNLYAPSTVTWKTAGQNCRLTLATHYPYDSHLQFTVETASPATFSIYLRIPAWARGATVSLNGKRLEAPAPGSFYEIRREWRSGSIIDMDLPFPLSLEPVDRHHPTEMALLRGPLVLFAIDPVKAPLTRKTLLSAKAAGGDGRIWSAEAEQKTIRFRTFPDIKDEQYRTYLTVT